MSETEPTPVAAPEPEADTPAVAPAKEPTTPPAVAPDPPAVATPPPTASPAALQLQALFPDTPIDIIEAVLEHDGTVEAATDTLLAMGDPSYTAPPHGTQIDADAQLARQMVEEDRAEARRYRQEQQASARGPLTYTPYIPRRTRAVSGGAQSVEAQPPSPPPKDELDQLAEGFSKLAEQGKKTLGSFFSKVKQQIDSLDGPGSGEGSSKGPALPQKEGWTPPTVLPRPTPQQTRQPSAVPELLPRPTSTPVEGASTSATPTPVDPTVASSDSSDTAEASTEPKKDFSKIGLLPRQSVSLLEKGKAEDDEDDEDLEYVRSPFDDD